MASRTSIPTERGCVEESAAGGFCAGEGWRVAQPGRPMEGIADKGGQPDHEPAEFDAGRDGPLLILRNHPGSPQKPYRAVHSVLVLRQRAIPILRNLAVTGTRPPSRTARLPSREYAGGYPHRRGDSGRPERPSAAPAPRRQHPHRPAPVVPARAAYVDPGEDPLTSAHRELLEETGLKVEKLHLFWQGLAPSAKLPGAVGEFTIFYAATDAADDDVVCGEDAAMRFVDAAAAAGLKFGAAYAMIVPQFLASPQYRALNAWPTSAG